MVKNTVIREIKRFENAKRAAVEQLKEIYDKADEALDVSVKDLCFTENDLLDKTMEILKGRIDHNINRRIPSEIDIGFICFANTGDYSGVLFESENVSELKELWKK